MTNLPTTTRAARQLPVVSLLLSAAALVIAVIPGAAAVLQLDRAAVTDHHSVWQVVTCHWTHWSLSHLFWDVLAFAVLASLCERRNRIRFLTCLALAVPAIPVVLWFTESWMHTYRGLSGLDSAVFVLLAIGLLREALDRADRFEVVTVGLVLLAFVCKVGYEFAAGQTVFVDSEASGMVPVPMAHAIGALVGLMCACAGPIRCGNVTDAPSREPVPQRTELAGDCTGQRHGCGCGVLHVVHQ